MKPKDDGEEYDPIEDSITVIRLVLDFYLTPAQSLTYFNHTLSTNSFSAFLSEPSSRAATPSTPDASSSLGASTPPPASFMVAAAAKDLPPLMRTLEKAKSKKDGPTFLASIERYNTIIRLLKEEGKLVENVREMKGVKELLWKKIVAQCYERGVGPGIEELRNYAAFSDNVYGELLPRFVSEM